MFRTNFFMVPAIVYLFCALPCQATSTAGELKWKVKLGGSKVSLAAAGELKWQYKTGGAIQSSPAIGDDGTIYVGSKDSCLYAINPDGTLKWKTQTLGAISSSPAVGNDGIIYLGSQDKDFYAFNPDGTIKWSYTTTEEIVVSPALGLEGTIYFGNKAYLFWNASTFFALKPDASLKWSFSVEPGGGVTGSEILCSPIIGSDSTIYFGSINGYFYSLRSDGVLKWKYRTGVGVNFFPAIGNDNTIYFGSYKTFYALNAEGMLKWFYECGDQISSSPAISSDGLIYFGCQDNYLYALNTEGVLKWRYLTGDDVFSSPLIGADCTIYFGSNDKYLHAITKDRVLKWKFQAGDAIKSSPAISNDGVIYFGSENGYLYAVYSGVEAGLASSPWPKYHRDLRNTGNLSTVVSSQPVLCDFNGDGKRSITDVISLLLFQRAKPCNLGGDFNGDGNSTITDAIAMLLAMRNGTCPDAGILLASANETVRVGNLNADEVAYLEDIMAELSLTPEEEAAFLLALYGSSGAAALPKSFALEQNAPNPFNPATTISYSIPEGGARQVTLKVYDLRGRLVRTLVDEVKDPGTYNVFWNGKDDRGRPAASGVYLYRMSAGDFVQTRKMVLIK